MPRKKVQDITPTKRKKTIRSVSVDKSSAKDTDAQKNDPSYVSSQETSSKVQTSSLPTSSQKETPKNLVETKPLGHESSPSFTVSSEHISSPSFPISKSGEGSDARYSTIPKVPMRPIPEALLKHLDNHSTPNHARIIISIIFILFVGVLSLVALDKYFFSSTLTVTLKTESAPVNQSIVADTNPSKEGVIPFEVVTHTQELSVLVPETGSKKVERRASGKITIYNDYSKAPQRLIRNTRFETPSGLIYRVDESVAVPGQKAVNGLVEPGSVEVTVNADSAGDEYNIGPTTFTIPGFKGDPRFEKFTAKSTENFTGGFVGVIKTASLQDIAKTEGDIKETLTGKLIEIGKNDLPNNYVAFEKGQFFSFETLSPPESNEVKIKGTLHILLFDKTLLSNYLGKRSLPELEEGASLRILNIESLVFEPDPVEIIPWKTGHLPFKISGSADFQWVFDENTLKQDLMGKNKTLLNQVLNAYPGISKARVSVTPFWKKSFPTDAKDIRIMYEK